MSKSVKYSIVVAVYNRPEEMEELLHSLNNQSFKNFELIIVDDGSQISSREVYDSYKKNFQILSIIMLTNMKKQTQNFYNGLIKNWKLILYFNTY